jgi:hypothetical protein
MQVNFKHTKTDQQGDSKQKKRKDTFFLMCLNTTLICPFYWVSTLAAALHSVRQEANNFSLVAAARAKPKG